MSVDLYTAAYTKSDGNWPHLDNTCRDFDSNGDVHGESGKFVWVHKKGSPGKRKHWHANTKVTDGKVESQNDCIRWTKPPSDDGHNPCKDLGDSTLLLNGLEDFHVGPGEYSFGLKCTVPEDQIEEIIARGATEQMIGSGAFDGNGNRISFGEQILFGGFTKTGRRMGPRNGFCGDFNNLQKVVKDGKTCHELLEARLAELELKTIMNDYCKENRTDEKCRCLNVTGDKFIENCEKNPEWAGCERINDQREAIELLLCPFKADCPAFAAYGGNADCFAPGICTGSDIYGAKEPLPACATQMNVCNKLMLVDDIRAVGNLDINQSCDIKVNELANNKEALKAAIDAAREADELWKQNEYKLQLERMKRLEEDALEMERIRQEMADAQEKDRAADRNLFAQLAMHRQANIAKREDERMAYEQGKAERDAMSIGGKDPQTLAFYAAAVFCAIFILIFAVKI